MPLWDEYKKEAKDRGSLAFEVYSIISTPNGDMAKVKQFLPAHLDYQKSMEEQGVLMLAGPLSDESGENMEGIGQIIYRATSLEEARSYADADPMHVNGARSYTLRRWLINEGSLNISVTLSDRQMKIS